MDFVDARGEEHSGYLASSETLSGQNSYVLLTPYGVERGCTGSGVDFAVYNAVGVWLVTGARDTPGVI